MKKLFRKRTIQIEGFEGTETEIISYIISDLETLKNDEELTQEDVREADEVYLEYDKYENLGDITDEEIETLLKFGIIKRV